MDCTRNNAITRAEAIIHSQITIALAFASVRATSHAQVERDGAGCELSLCSLALALDIRISNHITKEVSHPSGL